MTCTPSAVGRYSFDMVKPVGSRSRDDRGSDEDGAGGQQQHREGKATGLEPSKVRSIVSRNGQIRKKNRSATQIETNS